MYSCYSCLVSAGEATTYWNYQCTTSVVATQLDITTSFISLKRPPHFHYILSFLKQCIPTVLVHMPALCLFFDLLWKCCLQNSAWCWSYNPKIIMWFDQIDNAENAEWWRSRRREVKIRRCAHTLSYSALSCAYIIDWRAEVSVVGRGGKLTRGATAFLGV